MSKLLLRNQDATYLGEVEILLDQGPLVVANAYDWGRHMVRRELYRIYHRRTGLPFGPYYATILLAQKALKRAMREIPDAKRVWGGDSAYFRENRWVGDWVEKNLGKVGELVGGTWVDHEGKPVRE